MSDGGAPSKNSAPVPSGTDLSTGSEARAAAVRAATVQADAVSLDADVVEVPDDSAPPSIPSFAQVSGGLPASGAPGPAVMVLPGHVIADRYEVLDVLGEGGMGIVYRCRDLSNDELVALKRVVPPDSGSSDEYVMWFYKEARALAALDHSSIVRALDFGVLLDGAPYLVMELARGLSLHDLTASRLSWPLLWSIMDRVLSAMAHAHARGIVHGDLKPSNVLVEEMEGAPPKVHILDFGLAWLKQDPHDERLDGSKAMEFAPHAGAGTPGYMAPEQILHEMHHVCGATDLYALGCILYKFLSGRSVFQGDPKELLKLHAYEDAPAPVISIDAPHEVGAFVLRLLAKRPWDRFEFAAEARNEWGRWRPGADLDAKAWRFPKVRRVDTPPPAASTKPVGVRSNVKALGRAPERAPGLLSIRQSPMVGREDVIRHLQRVCDDVIDADGPPHRLVILVGQAGVGKSRVAEWLCEDVHEKGTMIPLRIRYRPVRGPLDGMLGAVTQYWNFERAERNAVEKSLLARWHVAPDDKNGRAWVAGAAEWLRPTRGADSPIGPSGMRFTLDTLDVRRHVIRYTLRRIAGRRPLLFFLDDLHHASETTFEGLMRIHRDEPDIRIVMVGTVRSEDVQIGAPVAELIRQLREAMSGDVLDVRPMKSDETMQLLAASLPLDEASIVEAAKRSRGNPLFALQQLHAWALAGQMEFSNGFYRVPANVLALRPQTTAEMWDERVSSLPKDHRVGAYAAATLGLDVRRDVLHELLASLHMPADATIVSLQNAEVLLPRGPGRYSWPHALLLEHLLGRLNEREDRARLYRAAAQALAKHPLAGTRRIARQRVINLLSAGAADAAAQLLFEHIESSWYGAREPLATVADLDLLKGHVRGRSLALKHRWRAEALRHVGRPEEARTHADIARGTFEELGDRENLAHCLRLLGHISSELGESAEGLVLVQLAHEVFSGLAHTLGLAQCEAVIAEIEYLLGNHDRARVLATQGEAHFAELDQPLGRGQCLLLLSWVDHSEGLSERSRRLTLQARSEFERAGYRLGIAQSDASLAHLEHRLMNYHSAERGAEDARVAFETLKNPRGQASCERLLAMVALDVDDLDAAELHIERAIATYGMLGDPWGLVESKLLACQTSLARHDLERAAELFDDASRVELEEAEPKQHRLLTEAWLLHAQGAPERALACIDTAAEVLGSRARAGDHTPHLLGRALRWEWPPDAVSRIYEWRALLTDRGRRQQD